MSFYKLECLDANLAVPMHSRALCAATRATEVMCFRCRLNTEAKPHAPPRVADEALQATACVFAVPVFVLFAKTSVRCFFHNRHFGTGSRHNSPYRLLIGVLLFDQITRPFIHLVMATT
jgi:hypothetical protein